MSDRVIIKDPRGRTVSVPADNIPKGSTIIGRDVLPGQSATAAERNVSDVKNPEKEVKEVVATPPPVDEVEVEKTDDVDESEEPANPRKKK